MQGMTHQVAGDVLARIRRPPEKGVFLSHNEITHLSRRFVTEASRSAHINEVSAPTMGTSSWRLRHRTANGNSGN